MTARLPSLDPGAAEWLPMREARALLGVSSPTLRRWADAGRVTAWTTPGGHRRFERSALVSLLATRMGSPQGHSAATAGTCAGAPVSGLDARLQVPARALGAALVRCVQADPATRPGAIGAAQSVAADLGAVARRLGVPTGEVLAGVHALRLRILEALATSARIRGLASAELSDLLVDAVAVLDPVLDRLLMEDPVPVES